MIRNKTIGLLVSVVSLGLWLNTACAPAETWEKYNEAGATAYSERNYAEAEIQLKAALKKAEEFESDDPRLATSLNNLAGLYQAQGKYNEAEPLYKRALGIDEKTLGPDHPDVAQSLENYADLLRKTGRNSEAERFEARGKAIRAKQAGKIPANE